MGKNNSSLVSDSEATVFVDTSLGTHLVIPVANNETVSILKRKIEYEHQVCFTSMGKINVEAIKVKRKNVLYHLPDSLPVRNAFSGFNKDRFLSVDASAVHGERLPRFDCPIPLLIEGSKRGKGINIAYQNGSVDSDRETLKNLEIGVKHSGNDHCLTLSHETIDRPEQIREDRQLLYRVPTTRERKEDNLRKESDGQCNVSLEKSSPAESQRQHKNKWRNKDMVHLEENDASVQGFGEVKLQPDSIPPEISLGNRRTDVPSAMSAGNKNTTEEPCPSSASTMDSKPDSVIHRNNDTYKETEVTGKHIKGRKNASMEDASQSQPAAKKKRKFESISGLEDSLRENDVLVCDSNNETSKRTKPNIASEFSLGDKQNNANAMLDVLTSEYSDLLVNSSTMMNKKRKKSSSSFNQVAVAGVNDKKSGGEVDKVPSSLDVNNATDAGNMETKSVAAEEKMDFHPSEGVADLIEGVREDKESSQSMDSKSVMSEKHRLSNRDKKDGNDTHPAVTSELLDANGTLTPKIKKKRKTRKNKGIGATEKGSMHGISLVDSHEAVWNDHVSDKAKEGKSNFSQKDEKHISEKETLNSDFVGKTGNLGGNEVETLEQTDSKKKKKAKKTSGFIGETQSNVSGNGVSLVEPQEAVHGDHASNKTKEDDSNLSQKDRTDVSEKETESPDFVKKPDNLGGNEVGTLGQTESKKKKKAKITKGSIGETQIKVSGSGVSLDEPLEALHGGHVGDKALEEESNLSQKDRTDVPDFVRKTDNLGGTEVRTLEQTDSKKKKKAKNAKGSTGETQIKLSGHGVSLGEPREAMHGDNASDKAKEEESILSQKGRKDVSEKETERPYFVRKTDSLGGNEMGTLEQTGSKKKKKAKKNKGSIGETQFIVSGNGLSLGEPHEAVHDDHASDKAKEEESDLSQKERTGISEKETGRPDVRKADYVGGNEMGTLEQTDDKKKKKARKIKVSSGETQIKVSEVGISMDGPREALHGDHASDRAKDEDSNPSQKDVKFVSEKETESSDFVRKTDNLGGNELGTLEQFARPQENTESMKHNTKKKSKRKHSSVSKTSQNMYAEAEESGKNYGIHAESIPAQSNSMSTTNAPSHAVEHISDGTPLEVNVTCNLPENECSKEADNHIEVTDAGNTVNFDKHLVPRKRQHEVIASEEMQAKEMTRSSRADHEPSLKNKRKKLDSTGASSDLQSSLKSNKNQGSSGKFEAPNYSSMQPELSSSMPHPEKKVLEEVSKTGTDTPGKVNSDSKAAERQSAAIVSGTSTPAGEKNETFPVSNNKAYQSKLGNTRQLDVNQNHLADGKASGIDHKEIVNREGKRKCPAIPSSIFKDDSSGSSEDEGDSNASEAIAECLSDNYGSASSYSDGESNADMNSSKTGKSGGRSDLNSRDSGKKLSWSELVKSSRTYKKAKVIASQSQPEDDEFVPDSQPII